MKLSELKGVVREILSERSINGYIKNSTKE